MNGWTAKRRFREGNPASRSAGISGCIVDALD
jgi:hypothetical protein